MRGLMCVCVAAFAGCVIACGGAGKPVSSGQANADSKPGQKADGKGEPEPMLRADFRAAVMGKTEAEVIAAVGKPSSTADSSGLYCWFYIDRTKDPTTDKIDPQIQVVFSDGRVTSVNF